MAPDLSLIRGKLPSQIDEDGGNPAEKRGEKEKIMPEFSMNEMLKAGVHFGHQTSKWNPKMKPYIFCNRDGIHIIDIRQTATKLKKALAFISSLANQGEKVLFVATKKQAKDSVKKAAISCGMPYVTERWLGGIFTNFNIIKKQIKKLADYEVKEKSEEYNSYTKKEKLEFQKEKDRLERNVGGLRNVNKLPGCIFVIDIVCNKLAISEANCLNVPIVALVDTNGDPSQVNYPIPSNDDAIKVIEMMAKAVAEVIKTDYKKPTEAVEKAIGRKNVKILKN